MSGNRIGRCSAESRDDHLDDKSSAAQARKQPDDEQAAADELEETK
jgi:hypothetical protein